MTAKEYLGQAYRLDQRINNKLEQISMLQDLTTKATATISDMPHSDSPNLQQMKTRFSRSSTSNTKSIGTLTVWLI